MQERIIMKLCVEQAKMPKKTFVAAFTNNECETAWFEYQKQAGKAWSPRLLEMDEESAAFHRQAAADRRRDRSVHRPDSRTSTVA